jgi:hypothetical protein
MRTFLSLLVLAILLPEAALVIVALMFLGVIVFI